MKVKIVIPSDYKFASVARRFVYSLAAEYEFSTSSLRDITLVLDELINNAIEHGYRMDASNFIEIGCGSDKDYFFTSVTDFGAGFDIGKYKIPAAQDFDYYVSARGRGIFIVNSLADAVVYDVNFEGGTRIIVKKQIPNNISRSSKYLERNRKYFKSIASKLSYISGIKITFLNYSEDMNIGMTPRSAICKILNDISKYTGACETFYNRYVKKHSNRSIENCPFSLLCSSVPVTYKMENIGFFLTEPVLGTGKEKRDIIKNLNKLNLSPDFITSAKNELENVKIVSRNKLDNILDILYVMANQMPLMKMNKEELELLNARIQEQSQKFRFLYQVTRSLAMSFRKKEDILTYVYEVVRNIVGQCRINYWRYDADTKQLYIKNRNKRLHTGQGIAGWVAYTGKAALVSNINLDARYKPDIEGNAKSMLSIPVMSKNNLLGVLSLLRTAAQPVFSMLDLQSLSVFSVFVGYLIENNELYYQVNRQLSESTKLNALTNALLTIFDMDLLLKVAGKKIADLMEAEKCSLMLLKDNKLLIKSAHGIDEDIIKKVRVKVGDGVAGWVVEKGKPLMIADIDKDPRFRSKKNRKYKSKSFLSVPIKVNGQAIGVLNVTNRRNNKAFSAKDLNLLEILATSIVLAIQNIEFVEKLKNI